MRPSVHPEQTLPKRNHRNNKQHPNHTLTMIMVPKLRVPVPVWIAPTISMVGCSLLPLAAVMKLPIPPVVPFPFTMMVVPTTIHLLSMVTMSHALSLTTTLNNHFHNGYRNRNYNNHNHVLPIVALQEQRLGDNHQESLNENDNDDYHNDNDHNDNHNDSKSKSYSYSLSDYFLQQQEIQQAEALSKVWFGTTTTTIGSTGTTNLPFDCTACGKCCQTKGSVWMSPDEIKTAATLLQVSTNAFIAKFTSRTIHTNNDSHDYHDDNNNDKNDNDKHDDNDNNNNINNDNAWAKLRQNEQDHCIFLSTENQCQIYLARPTQCSTYPFWTNIMKSKYTWNAEVRVTNDQNIENAPIWTKEHGGCEGMTRITSTTVTTSDIGVDPRTALQRLQQYERVEQRFPRGGIIRHTPILPKSPTQS
jgi:Fe-S-cluster containining protein